MMVIRGYLLKLKTLLVLFDVAESRLAVLGHCLSALITSINSHFVFMGEPSPKYVQSKTFSTQNALKMLSVYNDTV